MLYLDDIQHTSPEFLQKFIGLADGTRRIEGMWQGQARSYDMRGKRFAIAMAGNPYTESGEVFKIPDMLANRADIYNLGDVQLLVRLATGEAIAHGDFAHAYSSAELDELTALLQRLFRARDVLLQVNQAYIESAAQRDSYRNEPPFKLQGSYRNMTKLAAKITALMHDDELDALLRDHYRGEAQTLTTGAQENLLKLAQLMDSATQEEAGRWQVICGDFLRQRKAGDEDADGSTRIANALLDVSRAVDELKPDAPSGDSEGKQMAEAVLQLAVTYRKVIMPLIAATEKRLDMDHSLSKRLEQIVGKPAEPRAPRHPAGSVANKKTEG